MSTVEAAEVGNFLPHENSQEYSLLSMEETVAPLREMQDDIDRIAALLSDEKTIVEDLFGDLLKIVASIPRVPLDPDVFKELLGEVEEAHMSPEGMLVYGLSGGLIGSLDLSDVDKRELLVKVVESIIPILRGVIDGTVVLEEPEEPWYEPPVEPVIEEISEEEVEVESELPVEEPPEVDEPVSEELEIVDEEPIEEPVEASPEELPVEEEQVLEEPLEPLEPEPVILGDIQEDLPEPPEVQEQEVEEMQPPKPPVKSLKDPQLGGYRRTMQKERDRTRVQMRQIRRLRAAKISQLREATGKIVTEPKKSKKKGLFSQVKGIFSSFFGKK